MDSQDHLFELVKSMTKSEKGYFKKINSFHVKGEQNSYMILFDVIDRMGQYDERILKKQLNDRIQTPLPSLKHYLYHQILEALDQYYRSSDVEINKWICKIEILYKKGLSDHAQKLVDKAIDYAGKKEKFAYLLQLTRLRYEYLSEEENKEKMLVQKQILNRDLTSVLQKIDNLYQFFSLRIELNILRTEIGYARNHEQVLKYKSLLNHPALTDESFILSNSARYHFHTIRSIIYDYMHDYEKAYESSARVLELINESPELFEEAVSAKIQTLQRKSTISCTLRRFEEAQEDIAQLRSLKTGHEKYLSQIFQYTYHQEFQIYLWTGQFAELLNKIPAFEEQYAKYQGKISKTFELRMMRQVSEACFIMGRFEEALEWINRAINITPTAFRDDIVSGIKMHEIFIHLELGNYRLVKSRITALVKYMRTKNKPFYLEQQLLSILEKLTDASDDAGRYQIFKREQPSVEKIFKDRTQNIPLKYFYLRAWFESKIKGIPVPLVLKQQLQEHNMELQHKYQGQSSVVTS